MHIQINNFQELGESLDEGKRIITFVGLDVYNYDVKSRKIKELEEVITNQNLFYYEANS